MLPEREIQRNIGYAVETQHHRERGQHIHSVCRTETEQNV
jgi:hypothetical protein